MPSRTRRVLSKSLLRGPALSAWTLRQFRRLDQAYVESIVAESKQPLKGKPPRAHSHASTTLRNLLVIADCMWEQNELVPDLQRRWPVSLLDLNPHLRKPSPDSDAEKVNRTVESFISRSGELQPDVILLYARATLLSEELFDRLRRTWKCPIVGMNLDDKATFFNYGIFSARHDDYQRWAGKFDLNLTNTLAAVDWYEQRGFPCLYSPQGVNLPDDLPEPGPKANLKYLFSFVGSRRLERARVVDRLRDLKIPITLFGSGWPGSQWADDATGIYRSTQINLGIGLCSATETQTTVKGRDFECPGVGACYLTTYNWELVNHWEMGKEILCYRTVEELVEMFSYYRRRPEECLKIAQAAFRRSKAEHTWRKRFERVFRELGLKSA